MCTYRYKNNSNNFITILKNTIIIHFVNNKMFLSIHLITDII